MIYLDNAATTYPKPPEVIRCVNNAFSLYGANPGRSGHDFSVNSANQVYLCREKVNAFFNGYGAEYVSFFPNCTYALNTAIKGIVHKGDHVVVSSLEHNSVIRPVHRLKEAGIIDYSVFKVGKSYDETLANFRSSFNANTRVCIVTAVSNVFGNILPLREMSVISRENGAYFFVDGAQGAGVIGLDMKFLGIDCLCLPGHKGLYGPMGTGLLLHNNLSFSTIIEGGTGTTSFEFFQPEMYPERLESGTLNVPAICGLRKGIEFVEKQGLSSIHKKEFMLCRELFYSLKRLPGVRLYTDEFDYNFTAPIVSFNVENKHSEKVSAYLNTNGIAVRGGFHCSPLAHISMRTQQQGVVRVSPSVFNREKDVKNLLILLRKIAI